jgi:EpsI family protein
VTSRREVLIGAACVLSSGTAMALKPRQKISLLPDGTKLSDVLPRKFGRWDSRDVSDLYAAETPDSLLARLYGQTVGRLYVDRQSGSEIMMLMAHGDSQSNELQLHRPEVCYPAFGFALTASSPLELKIGKGITLPARRLLAQSSLQRQAVLYWTRMGEAFPVSVTEQRLTRLNAAMHRYIPDGLLARFSMVEEDAARAFATISAFIPALLAQVPNDRRSVFVGTIRAQELAAVGPARVSR